MSKVNSVISLSISWPKRHYKATTYLEFGETPKVILSTQYHNHSIELQPGSVPPNIKPYRHPYAQKIKIENISRNVRGKHHST